MHQVRIIVLILLEEIAPISVEADILLNYPNEIIFIPMLFIEQI